MAAPGSGFLLNHARSYCFRVRSATVVFIVDASAQSLAPRIDMVKLLVVVLTFAVLSRLMLFNLDFTRKRYHFPNYLDTTLSGFFRDSGRV